MYDDIIWIYSFSGTYLLPKNILLPSEARPHRKYILYIYILECSMVAEGSAAEGSAAEVPAADSRPYTLANIILVLKTPIEVYNYILFLIYKYLRAMK